MLYSGLLPIQPMLVYVFSLNFWSKIALRYSIRSARGKSTIELLNTDVKQNNI